MRTYKKSSNSNYKNKKIRLNPTHIALFAVFVLLSGIVLCLSLHSSKAITDKGYTALASGDYSFAIAKFDEAIKKNPNNIEAYAGKAISQLKSGDKAGAAETTTTFITMPDYDEPRTGTHVYIPDDSSSDSDSTSSIGSGDDSNTGATSDSDDDSGAAPDSDGDSGATSSVGSGDDSAGTPDSGENEHYLSGETDLRTLLQFLFRWTLVYNISNDRAELNEELYHAIVGNGLNSIIEYTALPSPTANYESGTYDKDLEIILSGDGEICYIEEDKDFKLKDSIHYSEPILIAKNKATTTIIAVAYDGLFVPSEPAKYTYTLERKPLDVPEFSSSGGEYENEMKIALSNPNSTGTIYYTLDGEDPSVSSKVYTDKIYIPEGSTTVKARVIDEENNIESSTASQTYKVTLPKPEPKFDDATFELPSEFDDYVRCPNCSGTNLVPVGDSNTKQMVRCLDCANKSSHTLSLYQHDYCPRCFNDEYVVWDPNGYGFTCSYCGIWVTEHGTIVEPDGTGEPTKCTNCGSNNLIDASDYVRQGEDFTHKKCNSCGTKIYY